MRVTLEPEVGIFYLVAGGLWLDTTPLSRAGDLPGFKVHERSHLEYWSELVKRRLVPDGEYEEHPRGRVAFDTRNDQFLLLADWCILRKKDLVSEIKAKLHLLEARTRIDTDQHYRCSVCMGRIRETEP